MKTLFIPLIKPINEIPELKDIPKEIFIAYTIQYQELAEKIKAKLEKSHKILGFQQVLGCSILKAKNILLIGSGRFHALQLALQGSKVYIYEQGKIIKIGDNEIEKLKSRKKLALSKFYSSSRIGIIVSLKSGQEHLDQALELQKNLEKQGKKAYILISNNINLLDLENFQLPVYINTACPGLSLDSGDIINISDLSPGD
jgi:diphthamide biosynthesis enzyme Dph1/Dph2-like protein